MLTDDSRMAWEHAGALEDDVVVRCATKGDLLFSEAGDHRWFTWGQQVWRDDGAYREVGSGSVAMERGVGAALSVE